jgi:hypothetical protein
VADYPKLPGDFTPSTPAPTPDPPSPPKAGSSSKSEDFKPSLQSPQSSSDSKDSRSTINIEQNLNPTTGNLPQMSFDPSTGEGSNHSSLRPCTAKLNDTNFASWQYDILNYLGYHDLDGFIHKHSAELRARSDYDAKLKKVTTFIHLHLGVEDLTRFVNNLDVYDPKSL